MDRFTDIAYVQFVTPYGNDYIIQKVNLADFKVISGEYIALEGPTHIAFIALNGLFDCFTIRCFRFCFLLDTETIASQRNDGFFRWRRRKK